MSRRPSTLLWRVRDPAASGDSVAVEAVTSPSVRTIAAAELRHRLGAALLQVAVEKLPLRDVDRDVHVLTHPAPRDPWRNPVGDHVAPDVDAHQRIVLLGHVDADPENQAGVFDKPPAPLPAQVPVTVTSEVNCVI